MAQLVVAADLAHNSPIFTSAAFRSALLKPCVVSPGSQTLGVFQLHFAMASLGSGLMRDIKDLTGLLLGFIPWLFLLFLARGGLANLKVAILISLSAALFFGFNSLRKGFLLSWGTLIFFGFAALTVNLLNLIWVAKLMDLLANTTLATLMWGSILLGTPFALQFARQERPKDQWEDPQLLAGSRWISLVWAWLMTLSVALSLLRRSSLLALPEWFYANAGLVVVLTGFVVTLLFKRSKRIQRERAKG